MKYFLNCPVKECGFKIAVDMNAAEAECIEAQSQFKRHLQTHSQDKLIDTIFSLVMALEGFRADKKP